LYAVAKDEMFGRMLSSVERATWHGNPLLAVVITWALVQMFFLIGSLNQIARMCSVLFLLSYAGVNFACFTLDWASAPNFRPTFTFFTWHTW
jgi:potassium/chloride transporter 9